MQVNNHTCIRCGYSTTHLVTFKRHLARKLICNNSISDDTLETEYIKYNIINKLKILEYTQNKPIYYPKNDGYTQNKPIYYPKNNEDNINKCQNCKKVLSSYKNLWRHLKTCKVKKENENMIELVKLLNEQLKEQKEQMKEQNSQIKDQNNQIKELIKKAGITNIQQNIKLLSYGSTDISHLTDKDFLKCLNHSNFCIPHLIEKIHFNPKNPENHNIYISNIKNNYAMLYNGNKWILKDRDETIMNLIDDKDVILEQKLEEWIENGKEYPKIMSKFKRYIDKKDNNKVLNKIKDEIKLVLFNNREMVDKKQCL